MTFNEVHFSLLDYLFFSIFLIVSIVIGLYFAVKKRNHSMEEYLFGGKNLKLLPVSLSLAATSISGSSIIGQSMEVYAYGLHNWMTVANYLPWALILQYVFLPVFYELQLPSSFTYFEMRFDKSVKHMASSLYVITGFFVISLTIYVPALAFQEVTGINFYLVIVIMSLLCIWYTAIGGIRAVIWTDVFQCILIFVSGIVILIVGLQSVGGLGNVWEALDRGGRLTFSKIELDVTARGTIWSYLFSTLFVAVYQFGISQSSIQRFLSLSSFEDAKKCLWIQVIFCMPLFVIQFIIGGIIYTIYEDCDPLSAGKVKKFDQIFPHFVQEQASIFSGFNGIFIAGIFAAGLSTTSTLLNTLSGTIYNDFLSDRLKITSPAAFKRTMNLIVTLVGVVGMIFVLLIERMGTIFAITIQCFTLSSVGIFGLFVSGMIFPRINSKGAKCGVILSMVTIGVLIIGSLNKKPDPVLPLRIDGCISTNRTSNYFGKAKDDEEDLAWIFRINFQFYNIIGLVINISFAYLVSLFSDGNIVKDQRLLVKFLRKYEQVPLMNPTSP